MRQRELDRLLVGWQAALGLRDWTIELKIHPPGKMAPLVGECEYVLEARDATIHIDRGESNPESIIVHELLHLWTRQIREARKSDLVEEQALEAIGAALLRRSA